jgi:hypothetical protein
MTQMRVRSLPVVAIIAVSSLVAASGLPEPVYELPGPSASAVSMAAAVSAFLETLTPDQVERTRLSLESEWRTKWHYFPAWIYERPGISLGELSDQQRTLVHRILQASLSDAGYLKASSVIMLDELLSGFALELIEREGESPGFGREEAEAFGNEFYFFSTYGSPSPDGAWGWTLEGHHLSLNFTSAGGLTVGTPQFMGSNPARVETGPYAGWRVLGTEEDLGRSLISSLDPEQSRMARLSAEAPADIISGPEGEGRLDRIEGVPASDLSVDQQDLLRSLVQQYVHKLRSDMAADELAAMEEAGFAGLHFAWAGSGAPGERLYYRVHGPTLIIEFDNTDQDPNHVHTVLIGRDAFGTDLLREHHSQNQH